MNMKTFIANLICLLSVFLLISCSKSNQAGTGFTAPQSTTRDRLFDSDWLFYRGSADQAEKVDFNDSKWREVSLPHDWSIEDVPAIEDAESVGPFSKKSPGTFNNGYFMTGEGWYRKHFKLSAEDMEKQVSILFDGVFMNSEVWINGQSLGLHPNGYTAFYYELTKYLKPTGEDNILSVKVSNKGDNSRWYTGSGIYRHVYLTVAHSIQVTQWGVYVTTPKVSESEASVSLAISVQNKEEKPSAIKIRNKIISTVGKQVAEIESEKLLEAKSMTTVEQFATITNPSLWSDKSPSMYSVRTEIWKDNQLIDQTETKFGIRSLEFSPENGLLVNGIPTKLRGGCIHHDNGILGSVTFDRAEERRLEVLKESGYNAIRTSHNPPSKTLLDACDRMGIFVIDEAFDVWREPKVPDDFHTFFQQWWKEDLTSMMMRDRNHPSIVIWSVGNEIPEKDPKWFYAMADSLVKKVKELDQTRPVTQAICCHSAYDRQNTQDVYSLYQVQGYNYEMLNYEKDKKEFPNRIIVGTETFPKDAFENEQLAKRNPWVIGDFVWTAIDYFGENACGKFEILKNGTPENGDLGRWPWYNAWCGDLDVCGFKKPQSFYRDVVWGKSKLEMMVNQYVSPDSFVYLNRWAWPLELPHWTWPGAEGKTLKVNVYTTCKQVRLELNGKPLATKTLTEADKITLSFEVPYAEGTLKAIGLEDGKEVVVKEYKTSGKPALIRLTPDRTEISANINDLSYVKVEIVDKNGIAVPKSGKTIRFTVEGVGSLAAAGNGNPTEMQSFHQNKTTTFHGKCLAIVRPNGMTGQVKLKAEADGLEGATVEISCK